MVSGSRGRRAFAENMCDHVSVTNSGRKTWKGTHWGGTGCCLNNQWEHIHEANKKALKEGESFWAKCWLEVSWSCSKETPPCSPVQGKDILFVICKETQQLQRNSLLLFLFLKEAAVRSWLRLTTWLRVGRSGYTMVLTHLCGQTPSTEHWLPVSSTIPNAFK